MSEKHVRQAAPGTDGANDRFKGSFSAWFWGSMTAAVALHYVVFALLPNWEAEDVGVAPGVIETIEIPPEIEIPPPPEAIARPATPVVATAAIDQDITIERVDWDSNPLENMPPPPDAVKTNISAAPVFTPRTVEPALMNVAEVQRALQREYPPLLRDAGIGGVVDMWFFIDEEGNVANQVVNNSSGHQALDEAALRIASIFKFTPALNRETVVPVWVSIPINFTTN